MVFKEQRFSAISAGRPLITNLVEIKKTAFERQFSVLQYQP
jgi:hypothetical protein